MLSCRMPVKRRYDMKPVSTIFTVLILLLTVGCTPSPPAVKVAQQVGHVVIRILGELIINTLIGEIKWEPSTNEAAETNQADVAVRELGSIKPNRTISIPKSDDKLIVIIRDNKQGLSDRVFEIQSGTGRFIAVTNGVTSIEITDHEIVIDVTGGGVQRISIQQVQSSP
jgi:hypothetical protein